ncbi:ADP-ribosylation factor-like protein 13A isoform X3 [Alligator mississippiensis]|uniref:ADP-ribosylation factor-like protein 13A isoform X3 n=1 Tax=Alligator mississippiensis TaxID=8496 RepID=UPI002877E99B|nr:ADP-ribosylation factor-like protein 13A isoform X3 [Alligator mississippiensis]
MFHLFSHCWAWLQTLQEPVRKMTLLIVGLDNAGKTSLVTEILRVLPCDLLPTMKPNQTELKRCGTDGRGQEDLVPRSESPKDFREAPFIEPCSTTRNLHKSQYRATLQGLHWILQTIAVNYNLLSTRVQADFPEQRSPRKQEAPRKTERAHSQAQEEREMLTKRESSQGGRAKEEGTKVIKKKKVKVKVKKKGLVQSRSTTEEEEGKLEAGENRASAGIGLLHSNRVGQENPSSQETAPPFAGKSTKKKKKKIKNKIKSQQSSLEPWTEDISSTFDLYRRAVLALKMRQEQRKQLAAVTP